MMHNKLGVVGVAVLLILTSAPAHAVSPATQATATARIFRPLTISFVQNLDFGKIVLTGSSFAGEIVSMNQAGAVTCGSNPGTLLTCSGATQAASYKLVGTNNAIVTISCPGFNLTGPATLAFTPNAPATVNLGASGSTTGANFSIGGSITLASTTPDGVYTGTFNVTADYQ
jgi:Mat/Ecp fimbriae major subunit